MVANVVEGSCLSTQGGLVGGAESFYASSTSRLISAMNNPELNERLRDLRQTLPHGSLFQYRLADDSLYIEKLTIPGHARGAGTAFMVEVLRAADEAELPVELHARATGRSCDPSTSALRHWYEGLGFAPLEEEEEGLFMHRSVRRVSTVEPEPVQVEAVASSDSARRPRPLR